MGNCQAAEAATVVIQHPGGRVERLYWPASAADIMKSNPGYYVALVTHYISEAKQEDGSGGGVKFTRVKLLKAKDMLLLGQVYKLITSQEVTKALRQRRHEKQKRSQAEIIRNQQQEHRPREETPEDSEIRHQVAKQERDQQKSSTQMVLRGRHWRPSLQSISEMGS
ncbi:hypothetical protein Cni_G00742 [Canna indica]|uniref:Uncharacterized protein n=1 Tax=Canna indica TaxID=4628 RepID=A0AAQ3JNA1_9LILI|nr:hypothetical protein Cni_G00742 [Canna indica]